MPTRRPLAAAAIAVVTATVCATPGQAQAPVLFDLTWEMSAGQVRTTLERGGYRLAQAADSSFTFQLQTGTLREELSVRLREGRLWHVYYSASGDSASLQRVIETAAAAASRRWGAPSVEENVRSWMVGPRARFVLPSRPAAMPEGSYQLGIVYHRP